MKEEVLALNEMYKEFYQEGNTVSDIDPDYKKLFTLHCSLIELICSSSVSSLKEFLNSQNDDDFYHMPFDLKVIVFKLVVLQDPEDTEMLNWAINHLSWFTHIDSKLLVDLRSRLDQHTKE
ncbi:MAG: hypothetical protein WBP58_08235 [Chitinophagaceae bacterium]